MATNHKTEFKEKIGSTIAKEGNGNIQITFTIPFPVIKQAQDETVEEMSKDVEVPGFRKGNAPLAKVKEKIPQNTLIEHSLSHILPKALVDAVEAHKLKLAIYPKFELIKAQDGEDWQIRGTTCELPEVDLGDYKKSVSGSLRSESLVVPGKDKPENAGAEREKKEQTAIKALLDTAKVDVPDILVEEEANGRLSSLLSRIEKLGLALESYLSSIGKNAEDLRAEYSKQAREAITLDLVLSKVAESEDLKVDEKEIESAMGISQATNPDDKTPQEDRKRLLESILKRRKALDFLLTLP